jgi:eukaryotic-like serine/threonine-protein kinase
VKRGDLIAGRYRLDTEVGSGGTGEVWRAIEQGRNAPVVLEQLRVSHLPPDRRGRARERLRAAAGDASRMNHPHINSVHGLVEHEGDPWLVMEYVPAPNLTELTVAGPLDPRRAAGIGAQVAQALEYAHSSVPGVVHGSVAPRHVLVRGVDGGGDQATLTGFGLSPAEGDRTAGTDPAAVAYLAPEVANGIEGGPKADVFSLGATLYAAVEGHPPWGNGDVAQTVTAARKGVVDPPRAAGALGPVLMRMLESRPRERPTAAAAAQMLAEVARGERTDEPARRRRWPWIAVAAVVVVVAAAGLVVWQRPAAVGVDAAAPVPALGDPATADPCSLMSPDPLDRFGRTTLDPDPGNFDQCDVTITSGQDYFAARVDFGKAGTALPAGQPEERGGLVIVRGAPVDGGCLRTLRLSDGYDVRIDARSVRGVLPDPCAVADVATDTALAVLARGTVPRRAAPFEPGSLAVVDACGLLDAATVATVQGLETIQPDPGFAGWGCDWETVPAVPPAPPGPSISIEYDRNRGLGNNAGNPMKIAGRDAAAKVDGDGLGCDVTVLHRPYLAPDGRPSDELLIVKVDQATRVANPCTRAIAIATVAVERLPAAP